VKITSLLEIIDAPLLQNIQDFFTKTMDISGQTFSEKSPLTNPSNFTHFCAKYTQGSKLGCERCSKCLEKWLKIIWEKDGPVIFKCHAGLVNFGIPIIIKGQHLATVLGGKVLTEEADENHFRQLAKEIGINENEYVAAARKLRIVPTEKLEAIVEALNLIGNSITSMAYANAQLSKLGIDYKTPRNIALEEWLFLTCENVQKPLSAREFEVLKLIVSGKSNNEIAKELFISVHTAKAHVSSILEKFLVEDRVQIAVKAIREGFI